MCRREERIRGLVKNGMFRGKVRAFFNRLRKGRDGPPEKLPGAPPPFRSIQQILSAREGAQNT